MRRLQILLALPLLVAPLRADDGAASIAAGGLVLMKREPRITMAKEVLQISLSKVIVDYDFRNDSNDDITTTVAFPIAPYTWDDYFWSHEAAFNQKDSPKADSRISSFRLRVNGRPKSYSVSVQALVGQHDYAPLLRSLHVDASTFGHEPAEEDARDDFDDLSAQARNQLRHLGLIDTTHGTVARWTVDLKYYWQQRFPAHSITHIHHEYRPITGEMQVPPDLLPDHLGSANDQETAREVQRALVSTCVPHEQLRAIDRILSARPIRDTSKMSIEESTAEYFSHELVVDWVDFILKSANTWKQPIEDFTLILKQNRLAPPRSAWFCSDGPLVDDGNQSYVFHARGYTPSQDLHIGFFHY